MSYQRQGATRTVEESLRKRNGESREAARGFHSLTCCIFCPPPPLRRAFTCAHGNDSAAQMRLESFVRRSASNGRSHSGRSGLAVLNVQLSSETLRLVPLTLGSVMSSQRQGATRTVEESLRKRNGESREAARGFHSLRSAYFGRRRPCGALFPAPLEPNRRRRSALDRLARRTATSGRSHSET